MFCKDCGQEIKDGVKFCPHCGAVVTKQPESMAVMIPEETGKKRIREIGDEEKQKQSSVLGMGSFLGYRIIELIPVIGFIVMLVFAISSPNKNRENYARGYFLFLLVQIVIMIVLWMCRNAVWRMIYEILYSM